MDPHFVNPFDRERDRIIRDYKFMTEREKREALAAVDEAERRAEERAKPRHRGCA